MSFRDWLLGPPVEPRESAWAIRELFRSAQADIDAGRSKAAKQIFKGPNLAKTHIGWFKRRILRGEFRRRA